MTGAMVAKHVTDLHVQCSLDMRTPTEKKRGGFTMSDCCRKPATSAVETPDGNRMYRCEEHRGIVSIERGPVRETALVSTGPDLEDDNYGMYSSEGGAAVRRALDDAITVMSDGQPGALERAVKAWADARDERIENRFPEVGDTAVREVVAAELERAALARTFTESQFEDAWERWT